MKLYKKIDYKNNTKNDLSQLAKLVIKVMRRRQSHI